MLIKMIKKLGMNLNHKLSKGDFWLNSTDTTFLNRIAKILRSF